MNPPTTTSGNVIAALGTLALGALAGAAVGSQLKQANESNSETAEGILTGVVLASFLGAATAVASPKWRGVGATAALVGLGGIAALAVVGMADPALANSSMLLLSSPASIQITGAGSQAAGIAANSDFTIALPTGAAMTAAPQVAGAVTNVTVDSSGIIHGHYASGGAAVTLTWKVSATSVTSDVTIVNFA